MRRPGDRAPFFYLRPPIFFGSVIPAKAGTQRCEFAEIEGRAAMACACGLRRSFSRLARVRRWVPAFAGMTGVLYFIINLGR